MLAASHAQSSRLAAAAGQHGDVAGHRCPDPAHGARLDHEVAPTGLRRVRSPRTTTALPAGRPGCRHFERQRSRAVRGGRPSAAGRVAEGVQLPWPEPSTKVLSAVRGQLARAAAGRVAGSGVLPVVPVPAIGVPEHAARTSQAAPGVSPRAAQRLTPMPARRVRPGRLRGTRVALRRGPDDGVRPAAAGTDRTGRLRPEGGWAGRGVGTGRRPATRARR